MTQTLLLLLGLFLSPAIVAGAALDLFLDFSQGGATRADILRGALFTILGSVALWIPLRRAWALRRSGTARRRLEKLFSHAEPIMIAGALAGVLLVSSLSEAQRERLRADAARACAQVSPILAGGAREACLEAAVACYYKVRSANGPLSMRRGARAQCLEEWAQSLSPTPEPARE